MVRPSVCQCVHLSVRPSIMQCKRWSHLRYSLCPPTRNRCCCVYGLVTVPPVKTDVWGKGGLSVAAEDTSKKCTNKIIKPPGKKIHEPEESPLAPCFHSPCMSQSAPVNSTIILRSSQQQTATATLKDVVAEDLGSPSSKPQFRFSENVSWQRFGRIFQKIRKNM